MEDRIRSREAQVEKLETQLDRVDAEVEKKIANVRKRGERMKAGIQIELTGEQQILQRLKDHQAETETETEDPES